MKHIVQWLLAATLGAACQNLAAVELYGYIRALGGTTDSRSAACYKLAGAATKYRMGNECEVYGEFRVGQQLNAFDDGSELKAYVMVSNFKPMTDDALLQDGRSDSRFAQAYVTWDKLAALNGGSLWAGRRYYKREDIHVTDFFYWNPQGLGAGVEDVVIDGPGGAPLKFSYALFRDDNKDQDDKATRHDIQLRGFKVNPNGQLELGLSLIPSNHNPAGGDSGWGVTVQHRQQNIAGDGWNKLAVQYGVGPGIGLGNTGPLESGTDVQRLRIVEGIYAQMTPRLGGMLTAVYQRDMADAGDQTWTSLGGRVTYGVTRQLKLQAELGQDWVNPSTGDTRSLTKLTVAPTWAMASNFWARPELRFFCTYAKWNQAAADAAVGSGDAAVASLASNGVFGNDKHGVTIGLQFEGWW